MLMKYKRQWPRSKTHQNKMQSKWSIRIVWINLQMVIAVFLTNAIDEPVLFGYTVDNVESQLSPISHYSHVLALKIKKKI